ncbi:major facilitator superfamily domain-containing protein, partial [Crucibulum laeve]
RKRMIHFVALCWCIFIEGCNDGSTGPLLPAIQSGYNIGFSIVALLFVSNCIGFVTGAILNVYINEKLGFGKTVVIGAISQLIGYVMIAPSPPFPVMVVGYAFIGFGLSFQNAQANGFVASLKDNMTTKLGIMHAAYGLGAFSSPFLATYFSAQPRWSFHYIVLAALAISNVVVLILAFRFRKQDDILAEGGQYAAESTTSAIPDSNLYRQILGFRSIHFLTLFALI